jgi:hypothetical protein
MPELFRDSEMNLDCLLHGKAEKRGGDRRTKGTTWNGKPISPLKHIPLSRFVYPNKEHNPAGAFSIIVIVERQRRWNATGQRGCSSGTVWSRRSFWQNVVPCDNLGHNLSRSTSV